MDDHYLVLGVAITATQAEIRAARDYLAHKFHPDKPGGCDAVELQKVYDAWAVLGDPRRRAEYDTARVDLENAEQALRESLRKAQEEAAAWARAEEARRAEAARVQREGRKAMIELGVLGAGLLFAWLANDDDDTA